MAERERFEAWMRTRPHVTHRWFERYEGNGEYVQAVVQWSWDGWMARGASMLDVPIPEVVLRLYDEIDRMRSENERLLAAIRVARDGIEAVEGVLMANEWEMFEASGDADPQHAG